MRQLYYSRSQCRQLEQDLKMSPMNLNDVDLDEYGAHLEAEYDALNQPIHHYVEFFDWQQ